MRSVHTGSWDNVQDTLGFDLTSLLITGEEDLGAARRKLFEYDEDPHSLPEEVAERFNFIAKILNYLAGSFNDFGMKRWFLRKRAQLNGLRPMDILKGNWKPEDPEPQKVLALAEALSRPQDAT